MSTSGSLSHLKDKALWRSWALSPHQDSELFLRKKCISTCSHSVLGTGAFQKHHLSPGRPLPREPHGQSVPTSPGGCKWALCLPGLPDSSGRAPAMCTVAGQQGDQPFEAGPHLHIQRCTPPLSSPSWAHKTHVLYLLFSLLSNKNQRQFSNVPTAQTDAPSAPPPTARPPSKTAGRAQRPAFCSLDLDKLSPLSALVGRRADDLWSPNHRLCVRRKV